MPENLLTILICLSPALFAATAVLSWFNKGKRPKSVIGAAKVASIISIPISLISVFFVFQSGVFEIIAFETRGLGISLRLDPLSTVIFAMINLIGFVVLRFSYNYMDGDSRQGVFTGRLAATIGAVQLLVLSGNLVLLALAWIVTSFSLHRLLLFYPDRPRARIAARKKFIAARLSDASLIVACVLLYSHFQTGNLGAIADGMREMLSGEIPWTIELSALFIAIAAILKSALFPTHGWLIEVMETPTPVSALLHAGLLNAGPFLAARVAYVLEGSQYAPMVLIAFGGVTALFASLSYLTQTSVKTALGYSSVSHMGFSLLLCGLGLYSAAVLHLVAHSFYKAHAFLSSGSAIDVIKGSQTVSHQRAGKLVRAVTSVVMAGVLFTAPFILFGVNPLHEMDFLAIGSVVILGLSLLISRSLDARLRSGVLSRIVLLSLMVAVAFFALETGMSQILGAEVPALAGSQELLSVLTISLLAAFAIATLAQALSPQGSSNRFWQKMAIHFRNGFYTNAAFNRLVNALKFRQ